MKIDWKEYEDKDHVMAWFLVEAMSEIGIEKFGDFDSSQLDVCITVNGHEVPITGPMESLQAQLKQIEEGGMAKGREDACFEITQNIEAILEKVAR